MVPSSPDQARQMLAETELLLIREPGQPDGHGWTHLPSLPRILLPDFITDRLIMPQHDKDNVAGDIRMSIGGFEDRMEYAEPYDFLGSALFGRTFKAAGCTAITGVGYEVSYSSELQPAITAISFIEPLDVTEFASQANKDIIVTSMMESAMGIDPGSPRLPFVPLESDVSTEQQALLNPVVVGFEEADRLNRFLNSLYRQ